MLSYAEGVFHQYEDLFMKIDLTPKYI